MSGIHDVARAAGIKDTQAHALFSAITEQVAAGERVYVKGFGTFTKKRRAARTITSPQIPSGTVEVPEYDVIVFRPSPLTKELLNAKPAAKPKKSAAAPAAKTAAKPTADKPPAKKPAKAKPEAAAAE